MNVAGRLSLYAAGLAIVFSGAFGISAAAVPHSMVASWEKRSNTHSGMSSESMAAMLPPAGVAVSVDGYVLSQVTAPSTIGQAGELTFQIRDDSGRPLVDYATTHDKQLHLIVVRSDGTQYRHVHPTLDTATGTWSIPWTWEAAGTYRVFADFASAAISHDVTLTSTLDVAGDFLPAPATSVSMTDTVDGFTVSIDGRLKTGSMSELTVNVNRDGKPVTTLQPYLGAFGHLVALRAGDLAYLHVHPQGNDPKPSDTSGPTVSFGAEVPTVGRYLLYLDFQVDGQVHTAKFALDAARGEGVAGRSTEPNGH